MVMKLSTCGLGQAFCGNAESMNDMSLLPVPVFISLPGGMCFIHLLMHICVNSFIITVYTTHLFSE